MGIPKSLMDRVISRKNGLRDYMREFNLLEITEFISKVMDERVFTKAELAQELGTTEKYITNILEGRLTMNIKELSDILYVMGMKLDLKTGPTSGTAASKIDADLLKKSKKFEESSETN